MTRTAYRLALPLAALALSGCRGPSGSPDGSVKSFYRAAGAQAWGGMVDCLTRASKQKLGSRARAEAYFAQQFTGWKNFDISIDDWSVGADEKTATVRFICEAEILDRYKVIHADCSDTFSLEKEDDDKWHINLPAAQSLKAL